MPSAETPQLGKPARGSRSGRPIMVLLDLLGRRWALRVGWELREGRALSFRGLKERCGDVSSSVLNDRLHELRDAGLIERSASGYQLTRRGTELIDLLLPLDEWANRWV